MDGQGHLHGQLNQARRDTLIVIAAYRESAAIGDVVAQLRQRRWNVVVVDDGSDDGTSDAAYSAGATVVRHAVNLGQGAALRTGFAYALRQPVIRQVVTFDADGQHDPDAIDALLAPLLAAETDVVLGSRFLDVDARRSVPPFRRLVLRAATVVARLTTGLALTDSHNGLRAIRISALSQLQLQQDRMAHASEIQHEIARLGLRYREVPVRIRYTDYSRAKGQRASDAISILWDLLMAKTR